MCFGWYYVNVEILFFRVLLLLINMCTCAHFKKLDAEKFSQDKGKACFHDVGGGGALMPNVLSSVFALGKG